MAATAAAPTDTLAVAAMVAAAAATVEVATAAVVVAMAVVVTGWASSAQVSRPSSGVRILESIEQHTANEN